VLVYQFSVNIICLLSAGCDVARQLNSACNLRHSTDSVIYGDVVVVALEQFGLRTTACSVDGQWIKWSLTVCVLPSATVVYWCGASVRLVNSV